MKIFHQLPGFRVARFAAMLVYISAMLWPPAFAQELPHSTKRAPQASRPTHKSSSLSIQDPEVIDQRGFEQLLAKYRGKPLLVNFWATWCEPCRHEYPMLNELAKKYASEGLQVVGVSLDDEGEMILLRRFLARYKPIFPNFRKQRGKDEEFINAVNNKWTGSIPASFFYASDGRQVGQIVVESTRDVYEAAIRSVLASSGKDSAPSSGPTGSGRRR
jgi:thiol-disulfide isomerase/thioredoxin